MKKKILAFIIATMVGSLLLSGCGKREEQTPESTASQTESDSSNEDSNKDQTAEDSNTTDTKDSDNDADDADEEKDAPLKGKKLTVYCDAELMVTFQNVVSKFMEETKCEVNVTYANASELVNQAIEAKDGDLIIAGNQDEADQAKDYQLDVKELATHIPVLVVAKGNPNEIQSFSDLGKEDLTIIMGDTNAMVIGGIAKEALPLEAITNAYVAASNTDQLVAAVVNGQADATIVWKDSNGIDQVEIVDTKELADYQKVLQAVKLNFNKESKACKEFYDFLDTDTAKKIWTDAGYEY
ncbi:MAG: molybdate transport system substrate-binding protein [Clostridiales bacterium]|nr:molybdate transport system substrate-binding protein [Clostridiales bacterium]